MDDVHNLNAVSGNPIQDDVVWVRHDLTQAGNAVALAIQVRMLRQRKNHRFQPNFHAAGSGWVLVGDVGYDFAQIVAG